MSVADASLNDRFDDGHVKLGDVVAVTAFGIAHAGDYVLCRHPFHMLADTVTRQSSIFAITGVVEGLLTGAQFHALTDIPITALSRTWSLVDPAAFPVEKGHLCVMGACVGDAKVERGGKDNKLYATVNLVSAL